MFLYISLKSVDNIQGHQEEEILPLPFSNIDGLMPVAKLPFGDSSPEVQTQQLAYCFMVNSGYTLVAREVMIGSRVIDLIFCDDVDRYYVIECKYRGASKLSLQAYEGACALARYLEKDVFYASFTESCALSPFSTTRCKAVTTDYTQSSICALSKKEKKLKRKQERMKKFTLSSMQDGGSCHTEEPLDVQSGNLQEDEYHDCIENPWNLVASKQRFYTSIDNPLVVFSESKGYISCNPHLLCTSFFSLHRAIIERFCPRSVGKFSDWLDLSVDEQTMTIRELFHYVNSRKDTLMHYRKLFRELTGTEYTIDVPVEHTDGYSIDDVKRKRAHKVKIDKCLGVRHDSQKTSVKGV
jgi:hypothetical protein